MVLEAVPDAEPTGGRTRANPGTTTTTDRPPAENMTPLLTTHSATYPRGVGVSNYAVKGAIGRPDCVCL